MNEALQPTKKKIIIIIIMIKKKTILFYSLYRNLLVINVYLDGTSTNANQKYKTY